MSSRQGGTKAKSAQLGDISFDDWYETPVFEEEPDERLEQLATSRMAPVRLVGGVLLKLAPAPRPARGWRERGGRLLDAWAAKEAEWEERLEGTVLPKRWRA